MWPDAAYCGKVMHTPPCIHHVPPRTASYCTVDSNGRSTALPNVTTTCHDRELQEVYPSVWLADPTTKWASKKKKTKWGPRAARATHYSPSLICAIVALSAAVTVCRPPLQPAQDIAGLRSLTSLCNVLSRSSKQPLAFST